MKSASFQMIHELKAREYRIDIKKLMNRIAFQNLSEAIAETFKKNKWTEEDFSEIVETYRKKDNPDKMQLTRCQVFMS